MPDPIALNKDKKIIKKKLKPPKDKLSEKYPALAEVALLQKQAVGGTGQNWYAHQWPAPAAEGRGLGNWIERNIGIPMSSKGWQAAGRGAAPNAKRIAGTATGTGRMLYRGLGTALGRTASGVIRPFSSEEADLWAKATDQTFVNPMKRDIHQITSNVLGRDSQQLAQEALRLQAQRRKATGNPNWTFGDYVTGVAGEVNDPHIQQKEYQRILQESGPAAAALYEGSQGVLDEVGGLYGPLRMLPHVPGATKLLSNPYVVTAGTLFEGGELGQKFLQHKDDYGAFKIPVSVSGLLNRSGIDSEAIEQTWMTANDGANAPLGGYAAAAIFESKPTGGQWIPQQFFNENAISREEYFANVMQAGHKYGPEAATIGVLHDYAKSNGLPPFTTEHYAEVVIPEIRKNYSANQEAAAARAPAEAEPRAPAEAEPGMLDKIQTSLGNYGHGAARALGYGEQYKKLSPMMQAALPALLAAGGLGAGGYGLYKLFGGGSGEEEEEKTASFTEFYKKHPYLMMSGVGAAIGAPVGAYHSYFDDDIDESEKDKSRLARTLAGALFGGVAGAGVGPLVVAGNRLGRRFGEKLAPKTASAYPALTKAAFGSTEISIPAYMTEEEAEAWKKKNLPNPWRNAAISGLVGGVGTGLYSGIRRGSLQHGLMGGALGLGFGGLLGLGGGLADRFRVSNVADASVERQREYLQDLTDAMQGEEEEAKTASAANIPPHLLEKYPWLASSSSVEEALSDEEPAREEEAEATTGSADIPQHLVEKYPWLANGGSEEDDDDNELSWKEILGLIGGVGAVGLGGYGLYRWLKKRRFDRLQNLPTDETELAAGLERGESYKSTPRQIKELAGGKDYVEKSLAQNRAARAANPNYKDYQHIDDATFDRPVTIAPDGYPGSVGSVEYMQGPLSYVFPKSDHIGYEWSPYRKMWPEESKLMPKDHQQVPRYAAAPDAHKALMLGHEAGHITQSPMFRQIRDEEMYRLTDHPYLSSPIEQEAAAMTLKQWIHKTTGQFPQNDAGWDKAMDDYLLKGPGTKVPGTYFHGLWQAEGVGTDRGKAIQKMMRQRIREKGPRVTQNIKQNPLLAGLDFLAGKTASYPALTKSAIAIAGLPIDIKPEDFKGITQKQVTRIKDDLPHPLTQALKAGLASAAVSGTGQSLLDGRITPRAGKWALVSLAGGGLLGGLGQYLDNRRIRNALDDAVQKDIRDKQHV